MTRVELLLTILAEECNEVAQRASKAIRFGLDEVQEGQELNNAERIIYEFNDFLATFQILQTEGYLPYNGVSQPAIDAKKLKIEKWLKYSADQGVLTEPERCGIMCGECWLKNKGNSPKCNGNHGE